MECQSGRVLSSSLFSLSFSLLPPSSVSGDLFLCSFEVANSRLSVCVFLLYRLNLSFHMYHRETRMLRCTRMRMLKRKVEHKDAFLTLIITHRSTLSEPNNHRITWSLNLLHILTRPSCVRLEANLMNGCYPTLTLINHPTLYVPPDPIFFDPLQSHFELRLFGGHPSFTATHVHAHPHSIRLSWDDTPPHPPAPFA